LGRGGRGGNTGGRVFSQLKLGRGGGVMGGRTVLIGSTKRSITNGGGGMSGRRVNMSPRLKVGRGGGRGSGGKIVMSSVVSLQNCTPSPTNPSLQTQLGCCIPVVLQ
jgi:hypothetical protein